MAEKITVETLAKKQILSVAQLRRNKRLFELDSFYLLPEIIIDFLAKKVDSLSLGKTIIFDSNFGELVSNLSDESRIINIEEDTEKNQIAQYFKPTANFRNLESLEHSISSYSTIILHFLNPKLYRKKDDENRKIKLLTKLFAEVNGDCSILIAVDRPFLNSDSYYAYRQLILNNSCLSCLHFIGERSLFEDRSNYAILEIRAGITKSSAVKLIDGTNNFELHSSFEVTKDELIERWDYNFLKPENRTYEEKLQGTRTEKLQDLVEISSGARLNGLIMKVSGIYKVLSPRNIYNGTIVEDDIERSISDVSPNPISKALLYKGDIIISKFFRLNSIVISEIRDDGKYIADDHFIIVRGKFAAYLSLVLKTNAGFNIFTQQMKRFGRGFRNPISLKDFAKIRIPVLPIRNLHYASEKKLLKHSHRELLQIKEEYDVLKKRYENDIASYLEREILERMQSTLESVLERLDQIESKIDNISLYLVELVEECQAIKKLPRSIEEKFDRLTQKLDKKLSEIELEESELNSYIDEIKRWLEQFDLLESTSKKYLPEAEYIYDKISGLKNADFSPFVIQYCRAFENELLNKLFRAYVQSLIDRKIIFEVSFSWDISTNEKGTFNNQNTYKLASHLKKCISQPREQWYFELGSMEMNLRYLTGKTVKKSPLLQDLNEFVLSNFEQELLDVDYLNDIKNKIIEYRNQSAHPNFIDTSEAIEFKKEIKKCIVKLMETYKSQ
jgi:hypothetical protein